MEQVSVHVRPDVARALQAGEQETPASREILEEASRLGVALEPVHPGTSAPDLLTHFTVYVEDGEKARAVVERPELFRLGDARTREEHRGNLQRAQRELEAQAPATVLPRRGGGAWRLPARKPHTPPPLDPVGRLRYLAEG